MQRELSQYARDKFAQIESYRTEDNMTLERAVKKAKCSMGSYYTWKKRIDKESRSLVVKSKAATVHTQPYVQEVPYQEMQPAKKVICLVGETSEIAKILGGFR